MFFEADRGTGLSRKSPRRQRGGRGDHEKYSVEAWATIRHSREADEEAGETELCPSLHPAIDAA